MRKSDAYSLQVLLSHVNNRLLEFLYTRFKNRYQNDLAEAFDAISNEKVLESFHVILNEVPDSSTFHYKIECFTQALFNEFNKRNLDEYALP